LQNAATVNGDILENETANWPGDNVSINVVQFVAVTVRRLECVVGLGLV